MYYINESDETLVMLTLAGEQNAYEVLVTRYQSAVISSAISVTKSRFMAEDAAQDAFVTAWMKLNTLQEPSKYASWVCRIAKNCAINMINRYRSFLPLDTVENLNITGSDDPSKLYALSEEQREVETSVERLPEKVRKIIHLHYFEGLSIAEIADRMRISEGTVKSQLHDGRKRIRKELCAMNEKYNDTLVQRVMKKVEELKLWQLKNNKNGFEKVYKEVLRDVEELPECREKQHALADVLMRGWWWIPGEKNDALFARITESAIEGKNEEVMSFIVSREDSKLYGEEMVEFIRDKQIPKLEKAGFVKTLGREWFWLGYNLFRQGKRDEALDAYNKVEMILGTGDSYRILIPNAKKMEEILSSRYSETAEERYLIGATTEEYRIIDGIPRYWSQEGFGEGYLGSIDRKSSRVLLNASSCDRSFFADISIGESHIGSDGTKLTYVSDNETVDTPAGKFDRCQLWEIRRWTDAQKIVCKTYYKDGVGIVRQDHTADGITDTKALLSYNVKGDGLLPLYKGNSWEYTSAYTPDTVNSELKITVNYTDEERIILLYWENTERISYDKSSWIEAVQEISNDYCLTKKEGMPYIQDVYSAIERAENLAITPMQKAHTKAASSVAKRILSTDPTFNPNYTAVGIWNFFERTYIRKNADSVFLTEYNPRFCFEWKSGTGLSAAAEDPVLFNDVYGILQDAANCLWSHEWRIGSEPIVEYTKYDRTIKTHITCEEGGTVTTKAGCFDNCLKLSLDIDGMNDGWSYRGGKKTYYFAQNIGIVRNEIKYCGEARTAVYELTSYSGTGDGYMPIANGIWRRYDALDLTDGFVGSVEYTYIEDEDGDIVLFTDRTGIREIPPKITQYASIQSEIVENDLWREKRYEESRLCHDVNNFHLLCHFFGRDSRYWAAQEKAVAWNKYRLKIMEGLDDGKVPTAWLGHYASTSFRTACALFGCGKKEEGYEWLEKAFAAYPNWDNISNGTEMDVGNPLIFGGIKVIKGKDVILLPDGTKEPITYEHLFAGTGKLMVYGMTAPHGWEWFNPVRDEERFKEYVERAKKLYGESN